MKLRILLWTFALLTVLSGIFSSCKPKVQTQRKAPTTTTKPTTSVDVLQKYSQLLGAPVTNEKLYTFTDQWLNTPYKYSGNSKSGIDCSHFTCTLLRSVYGFPSDFYMPSNQLPLKYTEVAKKNVKEGDLIFFSIAKNGKISHVGVYLANDQFVHASTSKGVIISSLNEDYYRQRILYYGTLPK